VLTACHVFAHREYPTVVLNDGLWKCRAAREWNNLDLALLIAEERVSVRHIADEPTKFPALSRQIPRLGTSLGYIGWLNILDDSGNRKGRTYFGQGHVAFFEKGFRGQTLVAVDGSAVEEGFSGGPAFTAAGDLCGVLVQSLQYAPKLGDYPRQFNSLPLISPIAPIRDELESLLNAD
jgi:hypothetical protein